MRPYTSPPVALLVRSWNLFHGNTKPPGRQDHLEEMVRLASADEPDVLCFQEVPVWALGRLGAWTGMTSFGVVAAPVRLGPLPSTANLGRAITSLNHGLFRSAFSGQANAILVSRRLRLLDRHVLRLDPLGFRRRESRRLRLRPVARPAR